ncbi:transposase [Pontiella sulfatireligans]|nr:transposase [Pontiella sulfatireligans]
MRKPRILGNRETNYYHVMSRVVNRDHVMGAEEKEFFMLTMRKLEAFSGLRILTYCIMSNHFHILVEVPNITDLDDDALLDRLRTFYSKRQFSEIEQEYTRAFQHAQDTGNRDWLDEFRLQYVSRMGDLSVFLKELKERFSKWYNRKHGRRGTLWEERFKSVLVENSDHALTTMAAYIDLNPVRAGLVGDPKEYRHCGYAEAVGGGEAARDGITRLMQSQGQEGNWRQISAKYRTYLFSTGYETDAKAGFTEQQAKEVLEQGGELPLRALIRCHVRYFNDGVALGSRLFIEEIFENNRPFFGERRKNGARKMRGGDWEGLYSLRNLSPGAIAAPG